MDRGAWGATVHRVAKSRTKLSDSAQRSYLVLLISAILFLFPLIQNSGCAVSFRNFIALTARSVFLCTGIVGTKRNR